jgi:hypothetical protein
MIYISLFLMTDKGEYWSGNINVFGKNELNPKEKMIVTIVFEKAQGIPKELSLGYSLMGKPGTSSSTRNVTNEFRYK